MPKSIWRIVRAKDEVSHLSARGWGSLSALWSMAQNAEGDEVVLVVALATSAVGFCNQLGRRRQCGSNQAEGAVSIFDSKTRQRWISRPAGSCIRRLLRFIKATTLRLGRRPCQNIVKGGTKAIQASMVRLLAHTEYRHLTWHAWRYLGATILIYNGATM